MKCQKCGADIPEGKIYCSQCGSAIQMVPDYVPEEDIAIMPEDVPAAEESLPDAAAEEEKPKKRPFKRYLALAIVGILAGISVYEFAYQSILLPQGTEVQADVIELLEKPEFSVAPGSYSYAPQLLLSHADMDQGTIYYTTDGSSPDKNSKVYLGNAIELLEGTNIIRAIFVRFDGMTSEEASGTFEIVFDYPDEPIIHVPGGDYEGEFLVSITSPEGNQIYYTTNGEEPSDQSTLYRGAIRIYPGLTVLQAIAVDDEGNSSAIVEEIYRVAEAAVPEGAPPEEIPPEE